MYDEIPEGEIDVRPPGDSQPARDAIDRIGDITDVGDPLDEWEWIEPDIPEIPLPEIPEMLDSSVMDFNLSDADLLDLLFGEYGGGGGGGANYGFDIVSME